jgi:HEAT repeat protein
VHTPEPAVLAEVAAALGTLGGPAATTSLVAMLGRREVRAPARAALGCIGDAAFDVVAAALGDPRQPVAVRANAPRALVEIDPERALGTLQDGLLIEDDGFVRFRILRALNRAGRALPGTVLDEDVLGRAAVAAVKSAYRYLAWRLLLEDRAASRPERRTPTFGLLRELLREKEENAVERLFRVLTLRYPRDDFRRLLRTLRTGGRRTRATGRELIENLLGGPAQKLTLALIDDVGDRERLAAMTEGDLPPAPGYHDLLAAIRIEEAGGTLAALAAHHMAELDPPSAPARCARPWEASAHA